MARFTKKFKIECVKNYKNHIKLETPDGWKEDNFFNEVKRWSGYYDRFGGSAFDKKKPEITYKEMVAICKRIEKGDSLTKVATYYGRSRLTIKRYYTVYLHDGLAGIKLRLKRRNKEIKYMGELKIKKPETTDEINELESLKRKVELQNIEIEYLKKLSALVRKRKAQQQKKK